MISVVIPTLNAQDDLSACLTALVPGVVEGVVSEVIITDGGSSDHTRDIVDAAGAVFLEAPAGRGRQMAAGANVAKGDWLLFLHADTVLESGWDHEAGAFIERVNTRRRQQAAAVFAFALDDVGAGPRILEKLVSMRSRLLRLPYGDQGLLISSKLYDSIGGYADLALMEDVDIMRRLRYGQKVQLRSRAVTSAARFRRDGYVKRSARNLLCLALYYLKVPAKMIERLYR